MSKLTLISIVVAVVTAIFSGLDGNWAAVAGWLAAACWALSTGLKEKMINEIAADLSGLCDMLRAPDPDEPSPVTAPIGLGGAL